MDDFALWKAMKQAEQAAKQAEEAAKAAERAADFWLWLHNVEADQCHAAYDRWLEDKSEANQTELDWWRKEFDDDKAKVEQALDDLEKARDARNKAERAADQARQAYDQARAASMPP
jgi:hypothetical protein